MGGNVEPVTVTVEEEAATALPDPHFSKRQPSIVRVVRSVPEIATPPVDEREVKLHCSTDKVVVLADMPAPPSEVAEIPSKATFLYVRVVKVPSRRKNDTTSMRSVLLNTQFSIFKFRLSRRSLNLI